MSINVDLAYTLVVFRSIAKDSLQSKAVSGSLCNIMEFQDFFFFENPYQFVLIVKYVFNETIKKSSGRGCLEEPISI